MKPLDMMVNYARERRIKDIAADAVMLGAAALVAKSVYEAINRHANEATKEEVDEL